MPSFKLASGGLDAGRRSGGLTPSTRSASGMSRIRTPQISTHAADIQFTPAPVPTPQKSNLLQETLGFGEVLLKEVKAFQARQNQVLADEAVLQYRDTLRKAYYGYADDKGEWKEGYVDTVGIAANDGFSGHTKGLKEGLAGILDGLEPAVKQKAILRMKQDYNSALSLASRHNAKQLRVTEEQTLYAMQQDVFQAVDASGSTPILDGTVDQYLAKLPTQQERDVEAAKIAKYLVHNEYNEAFEATKDPTKAYKAAQKEYDKISHTLSKTAENDLDFHLLGKRAASEKWVKKTFKERQAKLKKHITAQAPSTIYRGVAGGNLGFVFGTIAKVREVGGNVEKAITDGLDLHLSDQNFPSVDAKMIELEKLRPQFMGVAKAGGLKVEELGAVADYFEYGASAEFIKRQDKKDTAASYSHALNLAEMAEGKKPYQAVSAPSGMLEKNKEEWDENNERVAFEIAEGLAIDQIVARKGAYQTYKSWQLDGPLTAGQLKEVKKLRTMGRMGEREYADILSKNKMLQAPGYRAKEYKNTEEYKGGMKAISTAASMGLFPSDKKPSKGKEEEYVQWQLNNELRVHKARLALDSAAKTAASEKETFKVNEWWLDYAKNNLNDGKITKPAGVWVKDQITGRAGYLGGIIPWMAKGAKDIVLGGGTIMSDTDAESLGDPYADE